MTAPLVVIAARPGVRIHRQLPTGAALPAGSPAQDRCGPRHRSRTAPLARVGPHARSPSSRTTSWPAGPSPPSRSWTPRSWPGCPCGRPGPTAPTAKPSAIAWSGTTWPCGHFPRCPVSLPSGTCGRSARTVSSPSPETSTRCRPARSVPASASRSGQRSPRSCSMPPASMATAPHCRPPTPQRSPKGSVSSTRSTGTVCPTARTALSPPATSCPGPATRPPGRGSQTAASPAHTGRGCRHPSQSDAVRCPSMS